MPAILLAQKVKTSSTFSRTEHITSIPGCRVSSIVNIAEKKTLIRYPGKNNTVTLQVIIEGEIICTPSARSLSKGEYNLNAGPHQLLLPPGVNEFMRFEISPELLPVFIKQGNYYTSGTVTGKVQSLINIIRNASIKDDIQQLRLYTHITELITAAFTNLQLPNKKIIMNNPHHELVTKIQSYIDENLHKSISLSLLAGIYYISESKLKQDFKKYLNSSVQAYLQEQRMQKALKMLQHSDNEIVTIAGEVGYTNVSSFTREFRKHYACSPKEIRLR